MEPVAGPNDGALYRATTTEPSIIYLMIGMGVLLFFVLTMIGFAGRTTTPETPPNSRVPQVELRTEGGEPPQAEIGGVAL